MIKIFVTGDNHFGKRFGTLPTIKDELIESRFTCLEKMVDMAADEKCDFFVITGDLFDNTYSIRKKDVKRVIEILGKGKFSQPVLVLPGNHDYYSSNEPFWDDFINEATGYNIIVLNEDKVYELSARDEDVDFYPAYCNSKLSDTNRLDWIKEKDDIKKDRFNVGVAHGALGGLAIDTEGIYFSMSTTELNGIPMDAWFIGHAHVPYPDIPLNSESSSYTIFNAGTHEQLDLHNNTEGCAFVISLENRDGVKKVTSKRVQTGGVRYYDLELKFDSTSALGLEDALKDLVKDCQDRSIVRITLSGTVSDEDYTDRANIYKSVLDRFMYHIENDSELSEKITADKIDSEFSELGFASQFLKELLDDPIELQMAYEVVDSLRKEKKS